MTFTGKCGARSGANVSYQQVIFDRSSVSYSGVTHRKGSLAMRSSKTQMNLVLCCRPFSSEFLVSESPLLPGSGVPRQSRSLTDVFTSRHELCYSPSVHSSRAPIAFYHYSIGSSSRWHWLPSSRARPSLPMSRQKPFTVRHSSELSLPVRECSLSRETRRRSNLTTVPPILLPSHVLLSTNENSDFAM